MSGSEPGRFKECLADEQTPSALFGELYDHLHTQAGRYMRRQNSEHTLQPTALVHEAYLKLFKKNVQDWTSPQHFLAVAARTMMNVLVDHARAKGRQKRRALGARIPLDAVLVHFQQQAVDIIDLEEKLQVLSAKGPEERRAASVVELRAFAGLTMSEIAEYLRTPKRTIERDFHFARAWLHRELGLEEPLPQARKGDA